MCVSVSKVYYHGAISSYFLMLPLSSLPYFFFLCMWQIGFKAKTQNIKSWINLLFSKRKYTQTKSITVCHRSGKEKCSC